MQNHPLTPKTDDEDEDGQPVTPPRPSLAGRIKPGESSPIDQEEGETETPARSRSIGEIRSRVDVVTSNVESQYRSKLAKLIKEFSGDPDARIALTRLEPERWKGEVIKGFVTRYDLSRFKTMEDLLETIEAEFGGKFWELKIQVPNEQGVWVYRGSVRVHIAADPKLKKSDDEEGKKNGYGSPDEKYVKMALDAATGKREDDSKQESKLLDLMKSQNVAQAEIAKQNLDSREKEIQYLRQKIDDQAKDFEKKMESLMNQARPDSSIIQTMGAASMQSVERAAKDASTERERLLSDFSRERQALVEKYTEERKDLTENFRQANDRAREERQNITEAHTKEIAHLRDLHSREMDAERKARESDKQLMNSQLEQERRARDSDRQQFNSQLDAEKRQRDSDKTVIEERWKGQLDNQKTLFETQISNLKLQYENQLSNQKERLNTIETKLEAAERRNKDEVDRRLHEAEGRPDPIRQMRDTVSAVSDAAGMLGLAKQAPAEPKSEAVSLLEAAHKTGVIDKGVQVLGKVAEVFRPQPMQQQQQQPPIFYMPVHPGTGQPMMPMNPAMVMQQPMMQQPMMQQPMMQPQPVVQRPGPTPVQTQTPSSAPGPTPAILQQQQPMRAAESQPPQPAPRHVHQPVQQPIQPQPVVQPPQPTVELDADTLKGIVTAFDQMLEQGVSPKEFAQTIVATQPTEVLKPVVADGVNAFQVMVENVNPESPLLSMRGKRWLGDLFSNIGKLIEGK